MLGMIQFHIWMYSRIAAEEKYKKSHTEGKLKQNKISLPFGADCKSQKLTVWQRNSEIPHQVDSNGAKLAVEFSQKTHKEKQNDSSNSEGVSIPLLQI